ncbi:uncharacterized protein RAG0_08217 [Rhynchosporium agropyri]|uniref:Uncharacterized protein n=1 Tax=Rhynchosporium agropyri TaxID=914238 RepID=A0A1E1KPX8_9HELO|nr:uncharacterized protein RAG0_08217 [Rhynchosporium agropyri]
MRFQSSFFLTTWLSALALAGVVPSVSEETTAKAQEVDPKCTTVRCKEDFHPVYYPGKKHCVCEPDEVISDPSTCPLVKCTSTTRPVYHPETKSCSCDLIAPMCPNTIYCAAGSHKVLDPSTKKCACLVTNPIPKTCPQFKCRENHHVVYNPNSDKCGCTPDCPDLVCIAEQRVTYNFSTNSCSCKYIEGLEPSNVKSRALETHPITSPPPTPTKPAVPSACSDIVCISEKHPVVDKKTGECKCEWIRGLEPVPVKSEVTSPATPLGNTKPPPVQKDCPDTVCISEKRPTYNTVSNECTCEWIPGLEPGEPSIPIAPVKFVSRFNDCSDIICISEMHPVLNETTQSCECQWYDEFKPPVVS